MLSNVLDTTAEVLIDVAIAVGAFVIINLPTAIQEVRDGAEAHVCGEVRVEAARQP